MLKKQKNSFWEGITKFQKPIIVACLMVFVALLVYALIFYTPFNELYSSTNALWSLGGRDVVVDSVMQYTGIDYHYLPEISWVYNDSGTRVTSINVTYFARALGSFKTYGNESIQSFNNLLFYMGLVGIFASCVLFIYRSQLRKNYYKTNYVVHGLWSGFAFSMAITLIIGLATWYGNIHAMNMTILNGYRAFKGLDAFDLNKFNWIFILGFILAFLIIVAACLNVLLAIAKYKVTKKHQEEKALLKAQQAKEGE